MELWHRVVFTRAWGVLVFDDIASHAKTLAADPRFERTFGQIIDFRPVTQWKLTSNEIRELAALTPFDRSARRAFVVATDEAYGLARMFAAHHDADPEQFALLRAIEPAMEWVGLKSDTPWPDRVLDKKFGEG
jgi:hypothetical protein